MKYYFELQYLRLKRNLTDLGINPFLGISALLLSFIFISELILKKINYGPQLYLLSALIMASIFSEEIRNEFLKSIFPPAKFLKIRLLENLLLAIPFSFFLTLKNHYLIAILTPFFKWHVVAI